MSKKLLSAYWVHWYCLLVSGLLLSLEAGPKAWFKQLPWMVWGTELGQSYAQMQIPAAGSVWLALFWALIALGFLGILVAAVSLVVMSFETTTTIKVSIMTTPQPIINCISAKKPVPLVKAVVTWCGRCDNNHISRDT